MKVPGILQKTNIRNKRSLLIYVSAFFFMFAYTILAFSIASFLMHRFPENPNAIMFVGMILGISSFLAIFVDSFWAYLQKIKPPRVLTLWALVGLIFTVSIFFFANLGEMFYPLKWAIFTFMAAFLYGWSMDLYDVTVVTTIISRSDNSKLAQSISQKKVAEALGMVSGILIASFLVSFGSESFTQFVLLIFLIFVFVFFYHHFDKEEYESEKLEFAEYTFVDWKTIFANISDKERVNQELAQTPDKLKNSVVELAEKTGTALKNLPGEAYDLGKDVLEASRRQLVEILAKEGEIIQREGVERGKFSFPEMVSEIKSNFGDFIKIFNFKNLSIPLLWVCACVMLFSFWDTMVVTYQPLFLQEFGRNNAIVSAISGFLIILFIFPVFALQVPFSMLADRVGREKMVILGLIISGTAVIVLSTTTSLWILIIAGICGGAGYAAAFAPAQAMFVDEFNKARGIDGDKNSEKSAGSLRLTLNTGNIFGQFLGGAVFASFGFAGGFLVFGLIFAVLSVTSLVFYFKIRPQKEEKSNLNTEIKTKSETEAIEN